MSTQDYNNQDYNTSDTHPYIGVILHKDNRHPHIVALTPYNVTIPPHSRTNIPLQLPSCRIGTLLLLEPLNNGLNIARTVVWIHEMEYCPVWNDTDYPITLKYGTPIATVSTV